MDILKKRWIYVLSGFAVFLFLGVSLAWSIFVVPIETLFGWSRSTTSLAFTINILCFSVGSIAAGILSNRVSYSNLLKLAAIILCLGFIGTSLIATPWQLYLTYGVVVGTSIGMGYNCILSTVPTWLPEKSATATGILLMGYALSTAIFGPILNSLISSVGIVATFRILAIVCGAGIFIGSFMIRKPTIQEMDQLPTASGGSGNTSSVDVDTAGMIKKPIFWVYFLLSTMFAGGGMAIVNHASPMLTEGLAVTSAFAATVVSMTSITNGVARFLWGMIYDKLGIVKSIIIIGAIYVVSSVGMVISFTAGNTVLFIASICLLMLTYAGNAVTIPSITRGLFGNKNFSLNYSVVGINAVLISFFPTIIGNVQVATGTYTLPLIIILGIAIGAAVVAMLMIALYKKDYSKA